jgi:hypothetical protein
VQLLDLSLTPFFILSATTRIKSRSRLLLQPCLPGVDPSRARHVGDRRLFLHRLQRGFQGLCARTDAPTPRPARAAVIWFQLYWVVGADADFPRLGQPPGLRIPVCRCPQAQTNSPFSPAYAHAPPCRTAPAPAGRRQTRSRRDKLRRVTLRLSPTCPPSGCFHALSLLGRGPPAQ